MARTKGAKDKNPRPPRNPEKRAAAEAVANGDAQAAGVGHNSGLTDQQQRALLIQAVVDIEGLKEQMASLNGKLRNRYKQAKADGVKKKDIDFAIELRKGDEKEAITEHRRRLQIARWVNHPIGTQPDLFDQQAEADADREPIEDKVAREGELAGLEGKSCEPPSHLTGPLMQIWVDNWHKAQAHRIREGIKPLGSTQTLIPQEHPQPQKDAFDEALPAAGEGGDAGEQGGNTFAQTAAAGDAIIRENLERMGSTSAADRAAQAASELQGAKG